MSSGPASNLKRASFVFRSSASCPHILHCSPIPAACLLMIFCIYRASFPLISAEEKLSSYLKSNLSALLQNLLFAQNETLLSLMYAHAYSLLEKHQFCLLLWSFLLIFPQLWKETPESSVPLLDLILYYSFYLVKLCKHAACTHSLHLLSSNCFHMLLQSVSSTMNWNSSHQGLGYI